MARASGRILDPSTAAFYERPVLEVAPDLLGCTIAHAGVAIRLTEVEAYDGAGDPGSHAYRGCTPRTEVMFGPPGGVYVYFTYGMHFCANLVCGPRGSASAVLLRAGEVVEGVERARERRRARRSATSARVSERDLARGPARLAQALALGRAENGASVLAPDGELVVRPRLRAPASVLTGPRVGVRGPGGDAQAFPWRFWVEGEPTVSTYRPGASRRRSARAAASGDAAS